jgi:hypothetical protein
VVDISSEGFGIIVVDKAPETITAEPGCRAGHIGVREKFLPDLKVKCRVEKSASGGLYARRTTTPPG